MIARTLRFGRSKPDDKSVCLASELSKGLVDLWYFGGMTANGRERNFAATGQRELTANSITYRAGDSNYNADFNGANSWYIPVTGLTTGYFYNVPTVTLAVRFNSDQVTEGAFISDHNVSSQVISQFAWSGSGFPYLAILSGGWNILYSTKTVTAGKWTTISAHNSPNGSKIYTDGLINASGATLANSGSAATITRIGTLLNFGTPSNIFNGQIKFLARWNRVLSSAEHLAIHTSYDQIFQTMRSPAFQVISQDAGFAPFMNDDRGSVFINS